VLVPQKAAPLTSQEGLWYHSGKYESNTSCDGFSS
jgi:hypothetical protein